MVQEHTTAHLRLAPALRAKGTTVERGSTFAAPLAAAVVQVGQAALAAASTARPLAASQAQVYRVPSLAQLSFMQQVVQAMHIQHLVQQGPLVEPQRVQAEQAEQVLVVVAAADVQIEEHGKRQVSVAPELSLLVTQPQFQ